LPSSTLCFFVFSFLGTFLPLPSSTLCFFVCVCFFCAHFFHCLALYFCFVNTSSTISFYISLGSYEKKLAAPLPLWQHFYIANSIFMHFFALLRTSPLHPLAFVVFLCFVFFFVYVLVFQSFIYLVSCVDYYVHIFKMFFPCISCI
jgi:hypothetical protein